MRQSPSAFESAEQGAHDESAPAPDMPLSGHTEQALNTVPLLQSAALLQGGKRVHIAHNGACYQLQTTRQGKLILTK